MNVETMRDRMISLLGGLLVVAVVAVMTYRFMV